jgi:stress-induced morphogen
MKRFLKRAFFVSKQEVEDKLKNSIKFSKLEVVDISGGCGTSFQVKIKSEEFNGKNLISQHRMVNEILKEELKDIHSLQLKTEPEK